MLEQIGSVFYLLIYQPLLNILFVLYKYLPSHDFGIAIIVLTLIIRFLLYPLTKSAIKSQKALADLQPKIKEIQQRFKDDKERLARETLALYKESGVNPFAGILPLLIQLPILIALFSILGRNFGSDQLKAIYPFLTPPSNLDFSFLDKIDLIKPNFFLAVIAGLLQFWQSKIAAFNKKAVKDKPKGGDLDFNQIMQNQMLFFFPIFTVIILLKLPSALAIYWITTTLFSIIQQYLVFRNK